MTQDAAPSAVSDVASGATNDTAFRDTIVRIGNLFFKIRNALFPIVFIVIALATRPLPFLGSEARDPWLDAFGIAIALSGQALRGLVIGLAYIGRGGKDKKVYAETLVQDGIFAHSRNPLYVGNILVFLGLFVVLNSTIGYLVGIPFFFFAYYAIVLAEEDFLGRKFGGEYAAYRARVPRYLPTLDGLGETIHSMKFDWRRLIRKEYGSTFTWITTAFALLLWERFVWRGAAGAGPLVAPIAAAWVALIAGYATARFLKKTGRLQTT
ncbi:MAG: methyltransferase family protein [bacterium]